VADRRGLSPDAWYSCSRGSRVVMLALDDAKAMLAHAVAELVEED